MAHGYETKSAHNNSTRVENVKAILMKNLESVERGIEIAQDTLNSEIGDEMDPAYEQDQEDCNYEGYTDHSDFALKNLQT